MREFRDRDCIETTEGYLFTVVGNVHPKDRVLAYLKYVPSSSGKWGKGRKHYLRLLKDYNVPSLEETFSFLRQKKPQYMFNSKVFNVEFSAVPLESIKTHLRPEGKLKQLRKIMPNLDALQRKTVELAELISRRSGVPLGSFGVTGSLLMGIHRVEFSDMDLVVYGYENSLAVRETLKTMLSRGSGVVRRLHGRNLADWIETRRKLFPLTKDEVKSFFRRKWNIGEFKGSKFSIQPIKTDAEVNERYGDRIYQPEAIVRAEARVTDPSNSMFMPSVYSVKDVRLVRGPEVNDVFEVVSYEGFYGELADAGGMIQVRGKLERVEDRKASTQFHRILVGSPEAGGTDFIKPIE